MRQSLGFDIKQFGIYTNWIMVTISFYTHRWRQFAKTVYERLRDCWIHIQKQKQEKSIAGKTVIQKQRKGASFAYFVISIHYSEVFQFGFALYCYQEILS